MSIEKIINTYFFDGNPNKFAVPCVSEDGEDFLVAVRYDSVTAYLKFMKREIPCDEGQSIWEAAAILGLATLEKHQAKD